MKLIYLTYFIAICMSFLSCKDKEAVVKEKSTESIYTFVVEKSKDTDITIDSVVVLKIDPLTPKKDSIWRIGMLNSESQQLLKEMELQGQRATLVAKQIRVFNEGLGGAPNSLNERFKEEKEKFEDINLKIEQKQVTVDRLSKKIQSNDIDSVSHNGYVVKFKLVAHDKANVAFLDSQTVRLNKDFRIIQ